MDLVKQYVDLDLLSRLISYAIIAGSAIVKLPQIYNVVKAGTAKGLNLNSIYLETLSSLSGTIYNVVMDNPFRTYGETALILVQNIIIVLLFWSKTLKPSLGYQITAASVLVGAGAVLWNVRSLEAGWPKELSENNMSPLDCVCNLGTALLIIARVRMGDCSCWRRRPVPYFILALSCALSGVFLVCLCDNHVSRVTPFVHPEQVLKILAGELSGCKTNHILSSYLRFVGLCHVGMSAVLLSSRFVLGELVIHVTS